MKAEKRPKNRRLKWHKMPFADRATWINDGKVSRWCVERTQKNCRDVFPLIAILVAAEGATHGHLQSVLCRL